MTRPTMPIPAVSACAGRPESVSEGPSAREGLSKALSASGTFPAEADRLTAAHRAGDPTASHELAVLLGVWWRTERASLIAELGRRADGAR